MDTGAKPRKPAPSRVCGADIGAHSVFPVALDLASRTWEAPERKLTLEKGRAWIVERAPKVVAVDAPSRHSRGLLMSEGYRRRHGIEVIQPVRPKRVTEWRLGIGGCYATPMDGANLAGWMTTGMALLSALEQSGFELDVGRGGNLLEVHPT